ncbi:MAG: hypothetical protein P8X88_08710 [Gammaproteobacteria bacterium]
MKILFIVLLLFCATAQAEHTELELHLTSYHFSNRSDYEEKNYGIGITHYFKDRWGISAGVFNNSYDNTSVYLGLTYTYDFCSSDSIMCSIGVIGGVVTGYEGYVSGAGELRPIALPEFKFGYRRYFIKSRFFPETGRDTSSTITFSIGREF